MERDNLTMPVTAFLKMCRCKHLIPHVFTVEDLQSFIKDIYNPMTPAEYTWMEEKRMLINIYQSDVNPHDSSVEKHDDEPKLLFHEFIFLLATIATKKNTSDALVHNKIENFFI